MGVQDSEEDDLDLEAVTIEKAFNGQGVHFDCPIT